MRAIVPFLKLYIDFVENFSKSMETFDLWTHKNPLFGALIREVEVSIDC